MLEDVLKKNFLEDLALSLVMAESDIDEKLQRFKPVYGDAKIMLQIKMEIFENSSPLWKISNSQKLSDTLSKDTINLAVSTTSKINYTTRKY